MTQKCRKDIDVIWTTCHLPTKGTIIQTNSEHYQFVDKYVMRGGEEACKNWCWGAYDEPMVLKNNWNCLGSSLENHSRFGSHSEF
jgi:hypothetical protein